MSVLVYAENWDGKFKKATFEAVSYAYDAATKLGTQVVSLVIGKVAEEELKKLAEYGSEKIVYGESEELKSHKSSAIAKAMADAAEKESSSLIIIPHTFNGKSLAGRVSAKLSAGVASGAVEGIESEGDKVIVKKASFSGKGFNKVKINSQVGIVTITTNSFGAHANPRGGTIEAMEVSDDGSLTIINQEKVTGKIPLTEAELVVSGGRGLKGPENWNMIEELADIIGAGTACSKPVSDMDWRPHSEHVGQTGITIRPNLYIAVGISGAIQHQAGVNSSKVIVVVNKDPEAPFFKIADYGIVGDAFEVIPKLIEAAKSVKAEA